MKPVWQIIKERRELLGVSRLKLIEDISLYNGLTEEGLEAFENGQKTIPRTWVLDILDYFEIGKEDCQKLLPVTGPNFTTDYSLWDFLRKHRADDVLKSLFRFMGKEAFTASINKILEDHHEKD